MKPPVSRRAVSLIELIIVVAIVAVLIGITLSAVQRVRASAARVECQSKLRQLALAAAQYQVAHGHYPAGWTSAANPADWTYLAWTGRLLPFLEQADLWRRIEAAFAGDPNRRVFYGHKPHEELLATVVPAFACPMDPRVGAVQTSPSRVRAAFTSYLGITGRDSKNPDGVCYFDSATRPAEITDGLSNTAILGERPPHNDFRLGWWYRGHGLQIDGVAEMILGVREWNDASPYPKCGPGPYPFQIGTIDNPCDVFHYWSLHPGGANFAFADGSVRFLSYAAAEVLPALSTRAGNESVPPPD